MRGAIPPLFQMPSWRDAWSNKRIIVIVSVNGGFCEIRHWYAVALTAKEGVCTIRSVCLRGVQNAACGYFKCV